MMGVQLKLGARLTNHAPCGSCNKKEGEQEALCET